MSPERFNLKPGYNELVKRMKGLKGGGPYLIVSTIWGQRYLVASMDLEKCIMDGHLVFMAYHSKEDVKQGASETHGVMIPLSAYGGVHILERLPKYLEEEYKSRVSAIGFTE